MNRNSLVEFADFIEAGSFLFATINVPLQRQIPGDLVCGRAMSSTLPQRQLLSIGDSQVALCGHWRRPVKISPHRPVKEAARG